ncbi:recombinase family protein [Herbaspirillum sp. RTI4]|uniref:recombinase family protein n=1 Tax=Herbaspirillum sp. RTI4 TaxID=3048640 RepID=UPI002AB3B5CD|nr:recombinase family protein [Herbaspirillum sp. RTI4]MDY7576732.1 recombinase family protein [Herbaspirillum sp. RTI4]MDY7579913.1 recombinase family protein [Herbaspirillum sp. RTI4]MEA9983592.1 recombinase family protein [Herbaspirillum sp. RTI4]
MSGPEGSTKKRQRCAVYTRKSSEEGLDQEYNSIDAQRDAGHAYIASQRAEGWIPVGEDYDDPAFSGGNMERPGLQRLMRDIEAGQVDIVVVYKIDRLTRSLTDFSRMVEVFERQGVSFVSVTQQFNTTTSMGRLMLNVLLSFAQFEREVTGERIRDKIAASKRKGKWVGGMPALGYDVVERKLVINRNEADLVRRLFHDYPRVGSTTMLIQQLRHEGVTTKSWIAQSGNQRTGKLIDKSALYKILNNPLYLGQIQHKGEVYPGEHEALITQAQWDRVQTALAAHPRGVQKGQTRPTLNPRPALLQGLIFTRDGRAMTPHSSKGKGGRRYRYYLSTRDAKEGHGASDVKMLPAAEIEAVVMAQLRGILRSADIVTQVWREIRSQQANTTSSASTNATAGFNEMQVAVALNRIDLIWEQLFPLEQQRIVRLLIERIIVSPNELQVKLHPNGIDHLALDVMRAPDTPGCPINKENFA